MGVATRPIKNFEEYAALLERFAFRSGLVMKPVFAKAKTQPVRVIYAEGEDERVLRATQVPYSRKSSRPILVGRPWWWMQGSSGSASPFAPGRISI